MSKESYKQTLARLVRQLRASQFLRWWLGELSTMVPTWMRASTASIADFRVLALAQANSPSSLTGTKDPRDLALTLPGSQVLRKTLVLPLATEPSLRQVLEFQLEQHTPFPPGHIYFGYQVVSRDFERGQLTVEFVATPRDAVDAAIKTLRGHGVAVRAVFAEEMLDRGSLVNLLPTALGTVPSPLWKGPNPWLAATVGLLALAAVTMPIVIKREAVVQMLPWIEKGKKAAEIVDATRRELEVRVDQHNFVLEKRQKLPTVIQALEELTRVLPDDTWVQVLDLKGKELQIQGETASSVRLIGLFERSSVFSDASFRSPLTKGQASGTERYQLALQLLQPVAAPVVPPTPQQVASSPQTAVLANLPSSAPAPKASESAPLAPGGEKKP